MFDVDDTPPEVVQQAQAVAAKRGVKLCLSVRCFEVWIALHFARSAAPVINEDEAVALVRRHLGDYHAGRKVAPFDRLYPLSADACDNADWLRAQDCGNPATGVGDLVRLLLARLKAARERVG